MRFGKLPCSTDQILAHTIQCDDGRIFKKGRILTAADAEYLVANGHPVVWATEREHFDEIPENDAAFALSIATAGLGILLPGPVHGRCNLLADHAGLVLVDADGVHAANSITSEITLATVPNYQPVVRKQLVATIKIVPLAIEMKHIHAYQRLCIHRVPSGLVRVLRFVPRKIGLILTRTPGFSESLLNKASAAERIRAERLGSHIEAERRCLHDHEAIAQNLTELCELDCHPILVLGASAIADIADEVPLALEQLGGTVVRWGMPVDPGNLLLLGELSGRSVIGVPGCARSLRRSGYDFVLERLCVGLPVQSDDLAKMGAGGLLQETPERPTPREQPPEQPPAICAPQVAALVLAAGSAERMQGSNKLLAPLEEKPVICHVVDELLKTSARPIVVVTGHPDSEHALRAALGDRPVQFVANPNFADGLSSSLRVGLGQLDSRVHGALICLGDMPRVSQQHLEMLMGAFDPEDRRAVVVPTFAGKRGNPVLFSSQFFPALRELSGDQGAKELLSSPGLGQVTCRVPMPDDAVLQDIDTPKDLQTMQQAHAPG